MGCNSCSNTRWPFAIEGGIGQLRGNVLWSGGRGMFRVTFKASRAKFVAVLSVVHGIGTLGFLLWGKLRSARNLRGEPVVLVSPVRRR
jgi:hypothetical protein